ncbi:MAG TPA: hypothetical protein VGF55_34425 [Gemmataceae bacterium]|jgi:hypothetical protein
MNPSAVKLFLTLLWLVTGIALLARDLWTGRVLGFPFGRWLLPLAVPCLVLAAYNFARWWSIRSYAAAGSSPRSRRARRPQEGDAGAESNPAFQFGDPPEPADRGP